eukprot:c20059_g2_i1 orf=35-223(+)
MNTFLFTQVSLLERYLKNILSFVRSPFIVKEMLNKCAPFDLYLQSVLSYPFRIIILNLKHLV